MILLVKDSYTLLWKAVVVKKIYKYMITVKLVYDLYWLTVFI